MARPGLSFSETQQKLARRLAVFVSGYIKRFIEGQYDQFFTTEWGQKLKSLSQAQKLTVEAVLNILNVWLYEKINRNSALGLLVKEVTSDVPPEVSARMLADVKTELGKAMATPEEKSFFGQLLELQDAELKELLTFLCSTDPTTKRTVIAELRGLSASEMARLAKLEPAQLQQFAMLMGPAGPPPQRRSGPSLARRIAKLVRPVKEAADTAWQMAGSYAKFLKRSLVIAGIAVAVSLPVLAGGLYWKVPVIVTAYPLFLGLVIAAVIGGIALPATAIAITVWDRIELARRIAAITLWVLLAASVATAYLLVLKVWGYPELVVLLGLLFFIKILSTLLRGHGLSLRAISWRVNLALYATTFGLVGHLFLPALPGAFHAMTGSFNARLARFASPDESPRRVAWSADRLPECFDTATGQVKCWCSRTGDGVWELYDRPGYSASGGQKLEPMTGERWEELRQSLRTPAPPQTQTATAPAPEPPTTPSPAPRRYANDDERRHQMMLQLATDN